jgi:hypothetical protein
MAWRTPDSMARAGAIVALHVLDFGVEVTPNAVSA